MSKPIFNGRIILQSTNLVDMSAGQYLQWQAVFDFSDFAGVYLGYDVAAGDLLIMDTSGYDVGTVTTFEILAVVSTAISSFTATFRYLPQNNNPAGPPDVRACIDAYGYVTRPSTQKGLIGLASPGVQLLPDSLSTHVSNINNFEIVDAIQTVDATLMQAICSMPFPTAVTVGAARWYAPDNVELFDIMGYCGAAPQTQSLIFTVKKNGSPIGTITIPVATNSSTIVSLSGPITLTSSDYITCDVTQADSAAKDAAIRIRYK